jgi:transcriptional regulator with XRE-family HTH domain
MPRRTEPDPLAEKIGARVRALRAELGLTLEKLAFSCEPPFSKGQLSTIENGLAVPTATTIATLAEGLEVVPLDLLTFPEDDARQRLVDLTRRLTPTQIRGLVSQVETLVKNNR